VKQAAGMSLFIEAERLAFTNQLFLDPGGLLFGTIAPLNVRRASHAGDRFHPLFEGRRHKTS
jgi:hypothetical protein